MYFIPFIRDYIELLNSIYDSIVNDLSLQKIFQESIVYLFQTFKFLILYILSFQWFRDLIYLPTLVPEISTSIVKENFFLETPLQNIFGFLQIASYQNNKFLIGFLNSFFLALPFSCAQLIYIRRLLIQGDVAGIAAGIGNITGQIFFISSIIFGFRFVIIPWFSFEPFNYFIGIILLISIVYDMVHERVIKIIDWNNTAILFKIFLLNFCLIWTEQSCLFQFLGNVTAGANSTILEIFPSINTFHFFVNHINYLLGLLIGSIIFNYIFAFLLKNISEYLQIKLGLLRSTWIIRINFILLSSILAFSFSSIPFYGLDYLITGPLGFISNDKAFKNTLFSQDQLKDPFGILGALSNNTSLDTDVTSFDRGSYLKAPSLQTFEDLNYSGEYASTIRQGNIQLFDQYKEKARRIRQIFLKKDENENQQENTQIRTNLLQNQQNGETDLSKQKSELNIDYPTYYPVDTNIYLSSNIQKRFENNYKESSNSVFENILQNSLNNVFSEEKYTVAFPEIEKKLKERYYANPVYKFLLTIDIDTFLRRQPSSFLLSSTEENELYKKRLMIGKYHDTLRFYNTLPYSQEFNYFFNGSKSFADRIYNQQFKGTLHIARRLFSISSLNNESGISDKRVLKYDQPLFQNKKYENLNIHEELEKKSFLSSPFLEEISQNPLYIGWDESLKKVIITNRLLPKSESNFINFKNSSSNQIEFTTWPINKEKLIQQEKISKNFSNSSNFQLLFETKSTLQQANYKNLINLFEYSDRESGISYYESLPQNITKLASGVVDVIPPNRGGFIWPGNSMLQISLKDLLK